MISKEGSAKTPPVFKYNTFHSQLECVCPVTSDLQTVDMTAYRFTFKNTTKKNCSIPNLVISPKRNFKTCHEYCDAYALSFFKSFEAAEARLKYLAKNIPGFLEVVGDHVATCEIRKADGMASKKVDKHGHFNFHEFEATDFTRRFTNPKKINL